MAQWGLNILVVILGVWTFFLILFYLSNQSRTNMAMAPCVHVTSSWSRELLLQYSVIQKGNKFVTIFKFSVCFNFVLLIIVFPCEETSHIHYLSFQILNKNNVTIYEQTFELNSFLMECGKDPELQNGAKAVSLFFCGILRLVKKKKKEKAFTFYPMKCT